MQVSNGSNDMAQFGDGDEAGDDASRDNCCELDINEVSFQL